MFTSWVLGSLLPPGGTVSVLRSQLQKKCYLRILSLPYTLSPLNFHQCNQLLKTSEMPSNTLVYTCRFRAHKTLFYVHCIWGLASWWSHGHKIKEFWTQNKNVPHIMLAHLTKWFMDLFPFIFLGFRISALWALTPRIQTSIFQ